ncbi:unnamed protein product [Polarella glacialis]|uniref:Uncharacterized protein n=1 Tax=Polarella glacialis TaxID=89957 RepID=A0A813JZC8_POLGL|nr:unnamed protein product [Polarella glacialis]
MDSPLRVAALQRSRMSMPKWRLAAALLATAVAVWLLAPAPPGGAETARASSSGYQVLGDFENEPEKSSHGGGGPAKEHSAGEEEKASGHREPAGAEGEGHGEPEEAAEGHEEAAEGGEGEEHEVTGVTRTVSYLLFGFLVFDIVLLYLVNWQDANVRSYIYKMITTTVSIFCAVLLNQAIRSFILEQILPSPFPRGLSIKVTPTIEILVGLGLFVFFFAAVNVNCYLLRDSSFLFAVEGIGGHLAAFSGVAFFGHMQEMMEDSREMVAATFLASMLWMGTCSSISFRARQHFVRGQKKQHADNAKDSSGGAYASMIHGGTHHEEELWRECAVEAEDDATSIIMSFLVSQALALYISDELPALEGPGKMPTDKSQITHLYMASGGFLACLMLATWALHKANMAKKTSSAEHARPEDAEPKRKDRIIKTLQNWLAMSMSWCLLLSAIWTVSACKFFTNSHMDFIFGAKIKRKKQRGRQSSAPKVLRMIIAALGLLVGLSWEKAFDMCHEAIIEGTPILEHHKVISKTFMAFSIAAIVIPAWLKYLVPMAKKQVEHHEAVMNLEKEQMKNPKAHAGLDVMEKNVVLMFNSLEPDQRAKVFKKLTDKQAAGLSNTM